MGTLWGLVGYLLFWPISWLVLKSAEMGAQTILYAAMDADLGRGSGGRFLKECQDVAYVKEEIKDKVAARKLWEFSEKQIIALEKEGAGKRALAKKEEELCEKATANPEDESLDASSTMGHETKVLKSKPNKKKA